MAGLVALADTCVIGEFWDMRIVVDVAQCAVAFWLGVSTTVVLARHVV